MKRKIIGLVVIGMLCAALSGCSQQQIVNHNLNKEADAFNVTRRIVVMNMRTDKVLFELVGTFAISNNSSDELVVTCQLADGTYKKNYIYLNDWTAYIVEDLAGTDVSKYSYSLNILPAETLSIDVKEID